MPEDRELYLRQSAGPPKYSLPWYDAPPYTGKKVYPGLEAGARLGPVLSVVHVPRKDNENGTQAGYVTAKIRNPLKKILVPEGPDDEEDPDLVYVNVWCSDNLSLIHI